MPNDRANTQGRLPKTTLPVLRVRYALVVDVACITAAFAASCIIRFEPAGRAIPYMHSYWGLLWVSLLVRLPVYFLFGLYHHLWRYASTRELKGILAAGTVSSAIITLLNFQVLPRLGIAACDSRSVVILDWLLNLGLLSATRLVLRLAQERASQRARQLGPLFVPNDEARRVLIVGAGDAGARTVREMLQSASSSGMMPVAFVDDDPVKAGKRIHGVPVVGQCELIPAAAKSHHVDEVIIAMPSAPGAIIREVRRICMDAQLRFRTLPSIHEILDGKLTVGQLREVRIEDLLRRDPVTTDQAGVRAYVAGACVLVTGAGGSIGSELCRQIAGHGPSLLVLLGHGEFSIFNIERELRRRFPQIPLQPVIADVRDTDRIMGVVGRYRPRAIFHAAAHKHVPLMEVNVEDAFTNNVLGTQCVLNAAEEHGVERFVLISTDKAVNPTSVMGTTKRTAELLVQQAAQRTGRSYAAVRFGNVLGSRGSAIPIFQEQIAAGGPVTITHPEMRRYFMTIPEAVQLVLQTAALGHGGEVFMLDMGEPVRIVDLVNDLIELSGLVPGVDVEVRFTGMRPGEKLYEELSLTTERYGTTTHEKIFVLRNGAATETAALQRRLTEMAAAARSARPDIILRTLHEIVPEFQSPQELPGTASVEPAAAPVSEAGRPAAA